MSFKKFLSPQNLAQASVWINDTDPNSTYFQISQFPELLTAGKNAFLIAGSGVLVATTQVRIEIIDSQGNPVFCAPIPNYSEGLSRVISIEIYSDTAPGIATVTILGELGRDINGNLPPPQFVGAYNVKWQRNVSISPLSVNLSPIRLYSTPTVAVTESLVTYKTGARTTTTVSSSASIQGLPSQNVFIPGNPLATKYTVVAQDSQFISAMSGGMFYSTVNGQVFSSSISTVINDSMLQLDPGYLVGNSLVSFIGAGYTASYTSSAPLILTPYVRSFADITLENLQTFSGDIYRMKVFANSVDDPTNQIALGDFRLEATELMESPDSGSPVGETRWGYFVTQSTINSYWIIQPYPCGSAYNPG